MLYFRIVLVEGKFTVTLYINLWTNSSCKLCSLVKYVIFLNARSSRKMTAMNRVKSLILVVFVQLQYCGYISHTPRSCLWKHYRYALAIFLKRTDTSFHKDCSLQPEDRGSFFSWNIGNLLPDYTVSLHFPYHQNCKYNVPADTI